MSRYCCNCPMGYDCVECVECEPSHQKETPVTEKRLAKHIILNFNVGSKDPKLCRLVVGSGFIEMKHSEADALGDVVVSWKRISDSGLPSIAKIMERALQLTFSDLPNFDDHRLYPSGITCMSYGIEIALGRVDP